MNNVLQWVETGVPTPTRGVSSEAIALESAPMQILVKSRFQPAGSRRSKDSLTVAANEHRLLCTYDGIRTFARAVALLDALPESTSAPDVSVDPDKEISFDWMRGENMFSLSVGGSGRISYAADIGGKCWAGESFFGVKLSRDLEGILESF